MSDTSNITAIFDQIADGYDNPSQRFFPFCADRLVLRLRLRPGEKVLDVGTGTGVFATSAAQTVLPGGRVMAIDLSERMLERAEFNTRKMALGNIDLFDMDGAALDFKAGYFDVVACSFGLHLMPDMAEALREWRRVLRPSGRVGFTAFGPGAMQPLAELLFNRLRHYGVSPPEQRWRRLSSATACAELLEGAGFTDVEVFDEQHGYHLTRAEDWWEVVSNTEFRAALELLSPGDRDRLHEEHLAEVSALATEDGIWLDVKTLFAVATSPAA